MKINFINEKGIKPVNEDSYLIEKNIWGVFDGANSLNKYVDLSGRTGGIIASSLARDSFKKNDKTLFDMAMEANSLIKNEMEKEKIDMSDKLNLWCTNLAVVRIVDDNNLEWIRLSDAAIVFIFIDNSYKTILSNDEYDKETLLKCKKLADEKVENIRKIVDSKIKKVRREINVKYGFLTGEKEVANFIKNGSEKLENIKHILLFTDGFKIPQNDPRDDYSWDDFIQLYLEGGIDRLRSKIREIEKADPNCWQYLRLKKHDDMTAVSITF